MMKHRKRSGLTLIELIIAMSLIGIIISLGGTMMVSSTKSQAAVNREFQIQSEVRLASEVINQELRYSTAVFMLNEHQYEDSSDLKSGWSYFTLSDDDKEIVRYIWDKSTNTHKKESLVRAHDDILYNLSFYGVETDSRMINFKLDVYTEGSSGSKVSVSTVLNALNSAVVDDSGTPISPGVTLAYRSDDIPDPEKVKIAVTMVLDKSGSMGDPMGGTGAGSSSIRISVMKEKAKELIDTFADMDNVYISLISFSTNANNPGVFLKAKDNKTSLKNSIDSLSANGGTNAGDGLRRSYYQHVDFVDPDYEILHYTILLMDGNPTYWPSTNGTNHYYGAGDISRTGGTGNDSSISGSMSYIQSFCNGYIKKNDSTQKVFMKTFVIGFTGVSEEVSRAQEIANYHSHSTDDRIKGMYYAAANSDELKEVFRSIVDFILHETWHIYGPIR